MRQKFSPRKFLVVGSVVAIVLVGLLASGVFSGGPAEAATVSTAERRARPLAVDVLVAQSSDGFRVARTYTGEIMARRRSRLAFERLGLVMEIQVDDGQLVAEGAVLARLDDRHLRLARATVMASLDQARATLSELVAGPRAQTISAARARVAELDAQLGWADVRRKRRDELVTRNAVAREEVEGVSFETATLEAQRAGAAANLEELEEGTRKERIASQRAIVAGLEARIAEIDLDIEKSLLRAPFSGRIADRAIDEGSVLAAGAPVVTLVETSVVEARIGLPVTVSPWSPGQEVTLALDSEEVTGTFRAFESDLDRATRSRVAIVDVPGRDDLVPGRIVRVRRERKVAADGFWLPRTALVKSLRGLWACLVVIQNGDDAVVKRRALEILHDDGDRVFVRGTLTAGESVIREGVHRVVEGQVVATEQQR